MNEWAGKALRRFGLNLDRLSTAAAKGIPVDSRYNRGTSGPASGLSPERLLLQLICCERVNEYPRCGVTENARHHKRLFATHSVQCANVFFLRNTFSNAWLVRSHRWVNGLSGWLGATLDRFGMKARMKKLLRFGRPSGAFDGRAEVKGGGS